ncbi:hypothetical protein [Vitiosangium sp. GDMCC 1.1324]|uniref:hypothetical protein n=1 Tax=Vitiosangium sp. (strain GDMCC 1.1324) TaxID=2138576 RepID=UPI000D38686C|nr:hypothetical protein [Vitiosangium sp. GDMCC 1.1324]PTL80118.1 hypothetical protein DAT35_29295 [Vitiosangium sp. GDMCC 1.1324]
MTRYVLAIAALLPFTAAADGFTNPSPVYQRGNQLSQPLPDNHPRVKNFLDFYSSLLQKPLPAVSRSQLAPFPARYLDIADNGGNPSSGNFSSSLVCQSCHDSDWTVTGQNLPNMTFWAQGFHSIDPSVQNSHDIAANWSLFGDWSGSIKALAGRDPVFLAQVETTRQLNSSIQPVEIDNLCFRCHSPMAQRQAEKNNLKFSHSMLYSTPQGSGYTNPFPNDPLTQPQYATYGALARDGISCSSCHSITPDKLPWDGQDYSLFYGDPNNNVFGANLSNRLKGMTDTVVPPPFPFSAPNNTRPGNIVGPDTQLNTAPMQSLGLTLATASTQPSSGNLTPQSYLRDATVCGSCHAVILPKVPTTYGKDLAIPPNYERPASCDSSHTTFTGDYLTDPCVGLDYEQTTYFEWLNSGYSSGTATCLTCHMQVAATHDDEGNIKVAQYNADLAKYYGKNTQLTPRQYNRHTLLGINLFVHEMFQQFSDVLGIQFYKDANSVVPPYLQNQPAFPTSNLVPNPGAEDGNAAGWSLINQSNISTNSDITAVTSTNEYGVHYDHVYGKGAPHSGQYFFSFGGVVQMTVDLSAYASQIDTGSVKALVGGYVRCDIPTDFDICVTPSLTFQPMGGDNNGNVKGNPLSSYTWTPVSGTLNLTKGTRSIQIQATAAYPTSTQNYFDAVEASMDDLSITLQFPDGTQQSVAIPGKGIQQAPRNYIIAQNLLNAEQSIVDLALNQAQGQAGVGKPAVQVSLDSVKVDPSTLTATVTVTNNAGHKFPSGAPFRRAFLELELLDQFGGVLWASGQPNAYGAICNGPCNSDGSNVLDSEFTSDPTKLQPHRQTITRQDQVQIYELRATDDQGALTSKELQIFHPVKDNRILPKKWVPPSARNASDTRLGLNLLQLAKLTAPRSTVPGSELANDTNYTSVYKTGSDQITYKIPLPGDTSETNAVWVRVRLNYQSVPPPYLAARFNEAATLNGGQPGPAMQRLIYMTSRLNTDLGLKNIANPANSRDLMNNWTMVLSEATQPINYAPPPK